MYKTIDTLNALCVTLDGITAENYELNQSNLDYSEVHEQLADGEVSLIMYLESTLGKPKGPFIKSLECSLLAAEDVINTALKDANKEVFHDWWAVAALCRQWIDRIDGYYRYNPEPGTIAHALRKRMEELPTMQAQVKPQARDERALTRSSYETPAAKKLASPELQVVRQKLVDAGFIKDGKWMLSPVHFKELVFTLRAQWDVENRGGYAWTDCARWAGYPTDKNSIKIAQNAGKVNPGEALGDIAETIRNLCLNHTK